MTKKVNEDCKRDSNDADRLLREVRCSLIISDLHLSDQCPETAALFFKFIRTEALHAEALYILGDFMEYWIGDDDVTPFHQQICTALKTFTDQGKQLFIMKGNRDFLIGKRFIQSCGAILLPDPSVIECYGQRILLMHGDLLCTEDLHYQRYRQWVNKPWLQRVFLALPITWRRQVALKLRQKSQQNYQRRREQDQEFGDVSEQAVQQACAAAACQYLIHGHTHRFGIHPRVGYQRLVLSDWHQIGSYIRVAEHSITLHVFKN